MPLRAFELAYFILIGNEVRLEDKFNLSNQWDNYISLKKLLAI